MWSKLFLQLLLFFLRARSVVVCTTHDHGARAILTKTRAKFVSRQEVLMIAESILASIRDKAPHSENETQVH